MAVMRPSSQLSGREATSFTSQAASSSAISRPTSDDLSFIISTLLPLPIYEPVTQREQRLIENETADSDDDDGRVDVGEAKARAPDRDVVSKPDGIADHLGQHD